MWLLDGLEKMKNSDRDAVIDSGGASSFRDIWVKSNIFGRLILSLDESGEKAPILIYGDKHRDIIPAMASALMTGRAYVPVDISFPIERLEFIAKKTSSSVIFNFSDRDLSSLPYHIIDGKNYFGNANGSDLANGNEIDKSLWVCDNDICYIIFTSGSTGEPKGVPVTKKNLLSFLSFVSKAFEPEKHGDFVLNQASYSFDFSVEVIYLYLALGKTLVCIDKEMMKDTEYLIKFISDNKVAIWSGTPSFLDICRKSRNFTQKNVPSLEMFILGGEILTKSTASFILENFKDTILLNVYGPTETTVMVSAVRVTEEMIADEKSISIGYIMPGADYLIEKENGDLAKDGEAGELIIIGESVVDGYYKDEEKTAKSFFTSPDGRRAYRTGDIVYSCGGLLYFCGRRDFMVKLSGYRIELEDITHAILSLKEVAGACVIPHYSADGKAEYIAAVIVLEEKYKALSVLSANITVKKALSEKLQSYMIPRKLFFTDEMPLNTNGKIDTKELKARFGI